MSGFRRSGLETLLKAGHDCGCFAASTQSAASSLGNVFLSSSFLLKRCVDLNPGADKFEVRKFSKLFAALSETSYGPYTLMSPTKAMETHNQIPLVVLFGWSGARDAHLRSYAKAYASKGYRTLRGTSHQWYVVVPHGFSLGERSLPILCRDFLLNPPRLRSFALEAFAVANVCALLSCATWLRLRCLHICPYSQEITPHNDFIIHGFSNGGAFLLAEHLRSWSKGERTTLDAARVAGLVFDSAPAYLHANAGGKAMTASMPPSALRTAAAAAVTVLSTVWGALVGERGPEGYWSLMGGFTPLQRRDGSVCPELYVYSEDDAITRFHDLQQLVHGRATAGGSRVLEAVFKHSPHVSHLKTAPATYAAICDAFISHVAAPSTAKEQSFVSQVSSAAAEEELEAVRLQPSSDSAAPAPFVSLTLESSKV